MEASKTAIIGCGLRARAHANAAREGGALSVAYACDVDPQRATKAASEWQARAVTDYRIVLDDPDVESAIIATDVGSHLAIARDAVSAGKHMIIEKPLGDDVAKARDLVDLAEHSDRVTYVSFQLRFQPNMAAIKGALPEIMPVQIFFGRSRGMMKAQFLNSLPFCGIMDFLAHDFDLVSWFMGRSPLAVSAVMRRNTFTRDTDAADTLSALIDYGDGHSATIVSSIGAREIGQKCDIAGMCGNLALNTEGKVSGVRFARYDSDGEKTPLELTSQDGVSPDVELQRAFLAQIREGMRSSAASLRDGLNSLLVTLACLKSVKEQRRVELEELK